MRKFFGILFLIFGLFFVGLPLFPNGCTRDITASAEVEYPRDIYPTFELVDAPVGLSFPFHLGGVASAPGASTPVIPVDITLYINIGHDGSYSISFHPLAYSSDNTFVSPDLFNFVEFSGTFFAEEHTPPPHIEFVELPINNGINSPNLVDMPVYFIAEWIRGSGSNNVIPYLSFYDEDFTSAVFAEHVYVNYYTDQLVIYIDLPAFSYGVVTQSSGSRITFTIRSAAMPEYKPLGVVGNLSGYAYTDLVGYISPSVEYAYDYGFYKGDERGYNRGFNEGYNDGLDDGLHLQLDELTPWKLLTQQIDAFFDIPLFGTSVTFGKVLSIGFGLILLGLCIKIFLGG